MNINTEDATRAGLDMTVLTSFEEMQSEGEPDLIVELIDLYLEDAPRRVAEMRGFVAGADEASLRRAAHGLRGSSANLGAYRMAALCHELEQTDGGGDDSWQKLRALLSRLEQEFDLVRQSFGAERRRRS